MNHFWKVAPKLSQGDFSHFWVSLEQKKYSPDLKNEGCIENLCSATVPIPCGNPADGSGEYGCGLVHKQKKNKRQSGT